MARNPNETARKIDQKLSQLDDEGFNQMHREYRDRLIDSVTGFVRDRARAEDIADGAFQKAGKNGTLSEGNRYRLPGWNRLPGMRPEDHSAVIEPANSIPLTERMPVSYPCRSL